jgi:hypothetical protein
MKRYISFYNYKSARSSGKVKETFNSASLIYALSDYTTNQTQIITTVPFSIGDRSRIYVKTTISRRGIH